MRRFQPRDPSARATTRRSPRTRGSGLPRKVVGNRRVGAALRVVERELADIHQPVAARKRQTASQQLVHHAEHRGIGANTQGQRRGGDGGEPAVLAQHPQTEQQVVPEIVQPCDAPHVAGLLLEKRHVAEGSPRCTLRFVAPEPIGCEFVDELIEVEGDFLTQLRIDLILAEDRSGPVARDAKKPEDASETTQARLSSNPTADESRLQLSTSRSSCRLPSRVSA